ncbi:hypothetical protein IQ07DRAFT_213901 [Pyrenochaeta sp. DS3sAY3a]|nr:hypothetical protein IQ07DRAFT_213901 [Pyrenochaeta sp. DS3sAY3a]
MGDSPSPHPVSLQLLAVADASSGPLPTSTSLRRRNHCSIALLHALLHFGRPADRGIPSSTAQFCAILAGVRNAVRRADRWLSSRRLRWFASKRVQGHIGRLATAKCKPPSRIARIQWTHYVDDSKRHCDLCQQSLLGVRQHGQGKAWFPVAFVTALALAATRNWASSFNAGSSIDAPLRR